MNYILFQDRARREIQSAFGLPGMFMGIGRPREQGCACPFVLERNNRFPPAHQTETKLKPSRGTGRSNPTARMCPEAIFEIIKPRSRDLADDVAQVMF